MSQTADGVSTFVAGRTFGRAKVEPADRLGSWRLIAPVAQGTMAEIFRAASATAPDDQVGLYAVKRLCARWHEMPQAVLHFQREALIGRSLCHSHLIAVLAAQVERPPYYLVMPWLDGRSLGDRIREPERVPLAVALWWMRQTAEALAALAEAGWMHADVKPDNLMVSPRGHVTLLDLGLARRMDETGSIAERLVVGTPAYMAPETLTSALGSSLQSDIYSLGAVLFELLTGHRPFETEELGQLVRLHRQGPPPCVRRVAAEVPADVARLVDRMLAREPLRRPSSPREVADELARLEIHYLADRFTPADVEIGVL